MADRLQQSPLLAGDAIDIAFTIGHNDHPDFGGLELTLRDFRTLLRRKASITLKPMELHFTPEQEAQLAQIASQEGTDAERLVRDAALRLLEEDARFRAAVREGIAQADRGEFIDQEEMDARLEQMLRS